MSFFTMRRINLLIGLLAVVVGIGLTFWLRAKTTPIQPPQTAPTTQATPAPTSEPQKKDAAAVAFVSKLPPEVSLAISQGGPVTSEVRQPIAQGQEKKSPLLDVNPRAPQPAEKTPSAPPLPAALSSPARNELGPDPASPASAAPLPSEAPEGQQKAAPLQPPLTINPTRESSPPPATGPLKPASKPRKVSKSATKAQQTAAKAPPKETPPPKTTTPLAVTPPALITPAPPTPGAAKTQQKRSATAKHAALTPAPIAPSADKASGAEKKATKKWPAKRAKETKLQASAAQPEREAALGVSFAFGHKRLSPKERRKLKAFLKPLRTRIESVQVDGHTCALGSTAGNQRVSEQRAASVAALVLRLTDLDAARIHAQGFGETKPLCEAKTSSCRKKNRRVEITLALRGVSLIEGAPSHISARGLDPSEQTIAQAGSSSAPRTKSAPGAGPQGASAAPTPPTARRTIPLGGMDELEGLTASGEETPEPDASGINALKSVPALTPLIFSEDRAPRFLAAVSEARMTQSSSTSIAQPQSPAPVAVKPSALAPRPVDHAAARDALALLCIAKGNRCKADAG